VCCDAFRKLTPVIKGDNICPLDKVTITTSTGPQEITNGQDPFKAIIQRNTNHFHQAIETPFAKSPPSEKLPSFCLDKPTNDALLAGDISNFKDQSETIQALLSTLLLTVAEIPFNITTEEFIQGMKKVKEGKSSSMSG